MMLGPGGGCLGRRWEPGLGTPRKEEGAWTERRPGRKARIRALRESEEGSENLGRGRNWEQVLGTPR